MSENERLNINEINLRLRDKLMLLAPKAGDYNTAIEGLAIYRKEEAGLVANCFYKPLASIGVQGEKHTIIGSKEFIISKNTCLINCLDLPSTSHTINATAQKPYLTMVLDINKNLIAQLAGSIPVKKSKNIGSVAIGKVEPNILDAFRRLIELLDQPQHIPVLAPIIVKEIHYRLLSGHMGQVLRQVNTFGNQGNQVAQAINWLKQNYKNSFSVDELAQRVNMATSTFHRHFRQFTSLSPLQYQKCLRLYEAQRIMLAHSSDATRAGFDVGYESTTQFYHEYKRLFGQSPRRDINNRQ